MNLPKGAIGKNCEVQGLSEETSPVFDFRQGCHVGMKTSITEFSDFPEYGRNPNFHVRLPSV